MGVLKGREGMKGLRGGFSLIEIMVSLLIMGILATAGYPLLMGEADAIRLEQEARTIFEDLCLAKDQACATGYGNSTVNFLHFTNNLNNPLTSYEMFDAAGRNLRTALMDEFNGLSGRFRRNLDTRKVCVIPGILPGSTTNLLVKPIEFDSYGALQYPPGGQMRLHVMYFNASQGAPIDTLGTWTIEIVATSTALYLRREP